MWADNAFGEEAAHVDWSMKHVDGILGEAAPLFHAQFLQFFPIFSSRPLLVLLSSNGPPTLSSLTVLFCLPFFIFFGIAAQSHLSDVEWAAVDQARCIVCRPGLSFFPSSNLQRFILWCGNLTKYPTLLHDYLV